MTKAIVSLAALLALASCGGNTTPDTNTGAVDVGAANPASVYCVEQGGTSEARTDDAGNTYGVCVFADGTEVEEWEFFRASQSDFNQGDDMPEALDDVNVGTANSASVYCVEQGGTSETRTDADGAEYDVCILADGTEVDEWEFYTESAQG